MNREILFRGKTKRPPQWGGRIWCYGSLAVYRDGTTAIYNEMLNKQTPIEVDPETVGQYTGLRDKNGVKVFEGDLIKYTNNQKSVYKMGQAMKGVIVYEEYGCYWYCKNNFQHDDGWGYAKDIEVVGNVHDTPELLE